MSQPPVSPAPGPLALLRTHGADIDLLRDAIPEPGVLEALIAQTAWRAETIRLFGRTYSQPRLVAWHGDPGAAYRYSGTRFDPLPWTSLLEDLRARVQTLAAAPFNAVLLNYYRDGADSMGMHSDDEPELGPNPVIASLSLGAERTLIFRHKTNRALPTMRIPLPHASLLIMRGTTQHLWKHGINKRATPCGPRVNLTFRQILHETWRSPRSPQHRNSSGALRKKPMSENGGIARQYASPPR